MLPALLKKFGLSKDGGVSPVEPVLPLGIQDKRRFDQLNKLIAANWGEIPQDKIPDEVMIAVEEGKPVPRRRPQNESNPFAAPAKPKEKPRRLTAEQIQQRRDNARRRYEFRFPGPRQQSKGK